MNTVREDHCTKREQTLYPSPNTIGGAIIQSRAPILALTTAFTGVLTACLVASRGSWMWFAASITTSAMMGIWQFHIVGNSPVLVVRGSFATLYRRGVNTGWFELRDLSIAEGYLSIGLAFFALVLASTMLGALGLSRNLETSLSLRLSHIQRLILSMSGFWFAGAAVSLAYLDLPRRKLLLRGASRRPKVIYFDSSKQRDQMLKFLRALQLEEVMLRVGLDPHVRASELCDLGSPHDHRNGSIR
jgi:hypothetical protein